VGDEGVDGVFKLIDGSKDTASQAAIGELDEEAFDGVKLGGRGWREMEGPAWMLG